MPELALAIISIAIALPGVALTAWRVSGVIDHRPDPLEESAAAQRAAITAADTARASAHAAHVAELAEFDAEARRILDALDVPCVCSQVSTHEWDEYTQTYQQRWKVPEHFTACAKHWPATTKTPPGAIAELQRERTSLTAAHLQHQGGPMLTPAARVDAERARYVAEAWARRATAAGAGAEQQRQGGPPLPHPERLAAAMRRAAGAATTYGVPDGCTCVPDHMRAALANTHVVHRVDCATTRGPHAAEWRPMGDNG